jgi:hypothetical protein
MLLSSWQTGAGPYRNETSSQGAAYTMKHPTTQQLYAYWNDVRGARVAPRRFEIEPSRIASILPDTFILEHTATAGYRFRLAGTRICENFGSEFRGCDFLDGWTPEDRAMIERQLQAVTQQGGALLIEMTAGPEIYLRQAYFEILLLPLQHLQPVADRFIGTWCAMEPPSWLGSEPLTHRALLSCDVIWPDGRPQAAAERQDRQVPFLPHVRNSRLVRVDRRQFRVYDGGRTTENGES